jgi:hypothetical protein
VTGSFSSSESVKSLGLGTQNVEGAGRPGTGVKESSGSEEVSEAVEGLGTRNAGAETKAVESGRKSPKRRRWRKERDCLLE